MLVNLIKTNALLVTRSHAPGFFDILLKARNNERSVKHILKQTNFFTNHLKTGFAVNKVFIFQ